MRRYLKKRFRLHLGRLTIVVVLLALWQMEASNLKFAGTFSSPLEVIKIFFAEITNRNFFTDIGFTFINTITGYIIGNIVGIFCGILFWAREKIGEFFQPFVFFLASIPIFALAPMTILWWGTGVKAKIIIVILHVLFIAIFYAYKGAQTAREEFTAFFRAIGASEWTIFRHIIFPSATVWIFPSLRVTANFAILGEFIAEFISSDKGIGHYIIRSVGLYDVPRVLVGVIVLSFMSMVIIGFVGFWEKRTLQKYFS